MDNCNEKKNYAEILKTEDYQGISLDKVIFFPCDYIMRCVDGPYEGRQTRIRELGTSILIGTDASCNFILIDSEVSANHCKLNYIENTFYYTLEDLNSENGTWLKISSLENAYEMKINTTFSLFHHEFTIYHEDDNYILKFLKGSKEGYSITMDNEKYILLGKKGTIELDLPCSENHIYKIVKIKDRVFVINECQEFTNEGLFYKLNVNEQTLVRAGDVIKIGRCYFRFIVHNWGTFCEIGDRNYQEDKYCIIDDLRIYDEIVIPYYAVYDGHGGISCSAYLQKNLHNNLREMIRHLNLRNKENFFVDLCKTIQDTIIYTDMSYYENDGFSIHHGSTCVFLFFIGNKILCCNLGDSMGILVRDGKKIYLSKDFRPTREKEKKRISDKGGYVTGDGRLLGLISVSRGFGDWKFKDPTKHDILKKSLSKPVNLKEYLISNRAEFRIYEITDEDEYLILCSDGIFQHANSSSHIFDTINKYLDLERSAFSTNSNIINIPNVVDNVRLDVVNNIHADANTTKGKNADNMTLILIDLHNNFKI